MVLGTHLGVGVSTVVLGLIVNLRKKNLGIATAKIGSSLVEPTHHRRTLGRVTFSIDPEYLNIEQIKYELSLMSTGTDLAIIEGNLGVFDNYTNESYIKNQLQLAIELKTPIILVVDANNYAESISALVYGFKNYVPNAPIYGVIANRVKNKEHNEKIAKAISEIEGIDYLGGLKMGESHQIGGTLPGLKFSNPSAITRNRLIGNGKLVEDAVDLDLFQQITAAAGKVELPAPPPLNNKGSYRVAFADDQAFHLTVQDNLDLLRRAGAEIVPFSPIADHKLPKDLWGIYFPSGYPHLYALELSNNKQMQQEIWDFVQAGGKLYAEAGALPYFAKTLVQKNGATFDMIGILPAIATAQISDNEVAKVTNYNVKTVAKSVIAPDSVTFNGFADNRWVLRLENKVPTCFNITERERSEDKISLNEGLAPKPNMLLTRLNIHWGSNPQIAEWFLKGMFLDKY